MANLIAPSDFLVAECFEIDGIRFLKNDAWITSKSTPVTTESKIVFESHQKSEVEDLFSQVSRVKIFPSVAPVDLLSHEESIKTRDCWWIVGVK